MKRPAWLFSARASVSSHSRDLVEALVARGAGEARVHLGVLVGLALDRRLQVVGGRADRHAGHRVADLGEEVEVAERVAGLALGDRAEQRGDVGVALDVGLLREVEVPAVRLALARERLLEVVVGLWCRSGRASVLAFWVGRWIGIGIGRGSVRGAGLSVAATRRRRGRRPRPPRPGSSRRYAGRARGGRRRRASTSRTVPHRVQTR